MSLAPAVAQPLYQAPARGPLPLIVHGDASRSVRDLQAQLTALGFATGPVDGIFGPLTEAAVRSFQRSRGIDPDGMVGPQTRAALAAPPPPMQRDQRLTWDKVGVGVSRNFGHTFREGQPPVLLSRDGLLAWSDTRTRVTPDQWAAMPDAQRQGLLALVPPAARPAALAGLAGGVAARATTRYPVHRPAKASAAPTVASTANTDMAKREMINLLATARARSAGKRPDGYCYTHVADYLEKFGLKYGRFGAGAPALSGRYAKNFASLVDANPAAYGLKKLPLDNPYDAPAGAIVVVRAGTPGTYHPYAGDISIADGRGRFYNGGEMGYGGRSSFRPGNRHVLGIYVPSGARG